MGHYKIEYNELCKSCKGTGLYRGFGEKDGYAVECHTCQGSGEHRVKIEYDDFEHRLPTKDVHRVLQVNPGIGVGRIDNPFPNEFGGLSYVEWDAGIKFLPGTEMRKYTCPAWWYQSADYKKMPKWKECKIIGSFRSCPHFKDKVLCWSRWDENNTKN